MQKKVVIGGCPFFLVLIMHIVIVGTGGRLGGGLERFFRVQHKVTSLTRTDMDLADPEEIQSVLEPLDFDVLLNPAALTNVDYCETHEEEAFAANAYGPQKIAEICTQKSARMVHVSTDYVFDGEEDAICREDGLTNPLTHYGRSKRTGEETVLAAGENHLVIRTSWVFGPDRPGFVDSIIKQATEKDFVEAVFDKYSNPTYSLDFAVHLNALLQHPQENGIFHLCNQGSCSWQEYGQAALDYAAEAGVPLKVHTVGAVPLSSMQQFAAPRPVHTELSLERYITTTGQEPRPWQEALRDYIERDAARLWKV